MIYFQDVTRPVIQIGGHKTIKIHLLSQICSFSVVIIELLFYICLFINNIDIYNDKFGNEYYPNFAMGFEEGN